MMHGPWRVLHAAHGLRAGAVFDGLRDVLAAIEFHSLTTVETAPCVTVSREEIAWFSSENGRMLEMSGNPDRDWD